MDAFSDVLRSAQLRGGVFLHAEFTAPWCVSAMLSPELCSPFLGAASHLIPFHYVVEGEMDLSVGEDAPMRLRQDDVVLFPRNDVHLMGSDLRLRPIPAGDLIIPAVNGRLAAIRHGDGGPATLLICGFLGSGTQMLNPVIQSLPAAIKFSVDPAGPAAWIRATFEYAAKEMGSLRAGSETVLAKISELLLVEAVRTYMESSPQGQGGWLAGLSDPPVARALAMLHADVRRPWSVEALAREAGVSRSVLAERFTRTIGMGPMHYLAHWRLQLAAQDLKASPMTVMRIAERIGYESEAAFSRAFKKQFGVAPAAWRRAEVGRA
jgi:AraC-like DNA-binding protein